MLVSISTSRIKKDNEILITRFEMIQKQIREIKNAGYKHLEISFAGFAMEFLNLLRAYARYIIPS